LETFQVKTTLFLCLSLFMLQGDAMAHSITVQATQDLGAISPFLFGAGVEWPEHGNGILDPSTGLVRSDVVNFLKPLRLTSLRFPGGILADHYNWRDGVGPRSARPARPHPMTNEMQANDFGTDEFISLCKQLGAQPLITANLGTGTVQMAQEWQQYFKSKGLPVKYWEGGNEIYLAEPKMPGPMPGNDIRIYKTPAAYTAVFQQFAQALRAFDPAVMIGAIAGTSNVGSTLGAWFETLMGGAPSQIDFLSLHNSFAPAIDTPVDYANAAVRDKVYMAMLSYANTGVRYDIQQSAPFLQTTRTKGNIAITEHFPLFGSGGALTTQLDQSRTLASALYTATLLNEYIRNKVWMANYNLALSPYFGALLLDTPGGLVKTPVYHVYDLYRNFFGTRNLGVTTSLPTYATAQMGVCWGNPAVPSLDVTASKDAAGGIYLAVVNRDMKNAIASQVTVAGVTVPSTAQVRTLTGAASNMINGTALGTTVVGGSNTNVTIKSSTWVRPADGLYTFPPHSLTVFKW
jgi:alpha-L-arabinofuranosidase